MRIEDIRGSLAAYMKEISSIKFLSRAEELELSNRIKQGDETAVARLVRANLLFVVNVAMNYRYQGMVLADLIATGNIGLIKAARKFDGRKNFKFISYAVWWIRQAILQALADQSRLVKVPLNKVGDLYSLNKAIERLEARHKRAPTEDELMDELNASQEDIKVLMDLSKPYVSLDKRVDDDSVSLIDTIPDRTIPVDADADEGLRNCLEKALKILNERERKIIMLYYGLDDGVQYTLEEIGAKMALTRERVRQLRDRALAKLQTSKIKDSLKEHLWDK